MAKEKPAAVVEETQEEIIEAETELAATNIELVKTKAPEARGKLERKIDRLQDRILALEAKLNIALDKLEKQNAENHQNEAGETQGHFTFFDDIGE